MKRLTPNQLTAVLAAGTAVAAMLLGSPDAEAHPGTPGHDHHDSTEGHDPGVTWTVEFDGVLFDVPECVEEDGNVDGKACLWLDSDTGTRFFVDSANYRDGSVQ